VNLHWLNSSESLNFDNAESTSLFVSEAGEHPPQGGQSDDIGQASRLKALDLAAKVGKYPEFVWPIGYPKDVRPGPADTVLSEFVSFRFCIW
jgi:hypothetical protein